MSDKKPVLPPNLYPIAFRIVVALLAVGLFVPVVENVGVLVLLLTPVLATLVVVVTHWKEDRRLAVAALLALIGLTLVFASRSALPGLARLLSGG